MEILQSSFVIVGANTPEMKIYFNGSEVEGVKDLAIDWDPVKPKVVLTLEETKEVSAMKASGIQVRRSVL